MSVRDEKATVEVILKGQQANATIKEIEKSARALRAQLNRLPADSAEFIEKSKELQKVNTRLTRIKDDIKGTGSMFQWLGKEIKAFGVIAVAALGFQWVTQQISQIIQKNGELSDSLADIRKTTGMSAEEARTLNSAFTQMDTRTSTKELRNIAVAAGQLGIAKNDILKFTDATDKMVVALGDEFSGGATEVTKVMGGLRTIFSDIKSTRIDQDLLRIGNAVNVLASSGAATGPILTDFANRIGGVANSLGFTSAQTLGLSATLEELKIGTEKGSTATIKILQRMTTHVDEFAKVAGMSAKSFANLVNKDLFGAFSKVIEGSQKSGTSAIALGQILDSLGVDGAGASEVVTKLGMNMGLLKEKVGLAGTALKGTDSIMAEFNIKNRTLGADLEKLGKNIGSWFTNSAVSNGLKSMVGWLADLTDRTKKQSIALEEERYQLLMSEVEINSYNVGNETRTKLIKELQDKYPNYLKNIDAEKISHEALSAAIQKVNSGLIDKIIIEKQNEKIVEQAEQQADAQIKSGEARVKMLKDLARINEYNQLQLMRGAKLDLKKEFSGLPLDYQAEQTLLSENYNAAGLSRYNDDIINLRKHLDEWKQAEIELGIATHEGNVLEAERKRLMDAIGINDPQANDKPTLGPSKKDLEIELGDAKKHAKELEDLHKKLLADLAAMSIENADHSLSDREKEYARIWRKHEEMLARLNADKKASDEDYKTLNTHTLNEIADVNDKYAKKEEDERREHLRIQKELLDDSLQKELDAIKAKYDKEIEYNKQHNIDVAELEAKKDKDIQDALAKSLENQKADEGGYSAIFGHYKSTDELKSKQSQLFNEVSGEVATLVQLDKQRREIATNNEIKALDAKAANDVAREKRLLDNKLITQEEFNVREQEINREYESRKREAAAKQFEYEKRLSVARIIISGVEAIAKAFGTYGPTPAFLIASLAAGGISSAQIAMVNAQEMPAYAGGGMHNPAGYTNGPAVYNSSSGQPFLAGEAGKEYIVSNDMLKNGWVARSVSIMEAARTGRAFADGGYSGSAKTNNSSFGSETKGGGNDKLEVLLERLLNEGVAARLDYDTFNKDLNNISTAKNGSRLG
jgi:TP901 family phage tail tape measure protein